MGKKNGSRRCLDWEVTEQFLVENLEIENRDGPYTADDYIPTPKNIPADFQPSFDQNKHYNYNQKEEDKKEASKKFYH